MNFWNLYNQFLFLFRLFLICQTTGLPNWLNLAGLEIIILISSLHSNKNGNSNTIIINPKEKRGAVRPPPC